MSDTSRQHWERTYARRPADEVSWFQREPAPSLAMIAATGVGRDAAILDVGGGASSLVDHLLHRGYGRVTVLDVSGGALEIARARLGASARGVDWRVEDITRWSPPEHGFDVWHDRAVFHFLVEAADRDAYLRALDRGLRPGGHLILATFAPTGPERCSGLPVQRYSPEALQAVLGPGYRLVESRPEAHVTPAGVSQDFTWCRFGKATD
jgi:SAM-dependent methyltransferase